MSNITPEHVEEIRARLHAFAPPPQTGPASTDLVGVYLPQSNLYVVRVTPEPVVDEPEDAYAEFIGHAATDLSDMLAMSDLQMRRIKAVQDLCDTFFEEGRDVPNDELIDRLSTALNTP